MLDDGGGNDDERKTKESFDDLTRAFSLCFSFSLSL